MSIARTLPLSCVVSFGGRYPGAPLHDVAARGTPCASHAHPSCQRPHASHHSWHAITRPFNSHANTGDHTRASSPPREGARYPHPTFPPSHIPVPAGVRIMSILEMAQGASGERVKMTERDSYHFGMVSANSFPRSELVGLVNNHPHRSKITQRLTHCPPSGCGYPIDNHPASG